MLHSKIKVPRYKIKVASLNPLIHSRKHWSLNPLIPSRKHWSKSYYILLKNQRLKFILSSKSLHFPLLFVLYNDTNSKLLANPPN